MSHKGPFELSRVAAAFWFGTRVPATGNPREHRTRMVKDRASRNPGHIGSAQASYVTALENSRARHFRSKLLVSGLERSNNCLPIVQRRKEAADHVATGSPRGTPVGLAREHQLNFLRRRVTSHKKAILIPARVKDRGSGTGGDTAPNVRSSSPIPPLKWFIRVDSTMTVCI
jgi:hypothetical protein